MCGHCVCLLKSEIAFAVYANKMGKESYCMVSLRNLCSLKTLHTNVMERISMIAFNVRGVKCN